jgi:hypothetical protein
MPFPTGRTLHQGARLRRVLFALASPLLIALALLALLQRPDRDRLKALPALLIGSGLLLTSGVRRRRRRAELLRALRHDGGPADGP